MLKINLDKAKKYAKYQYRGHRKELFKNLDTQFMLAQEKGEDTSAIVAEKQKLRDMPEKIDSMTLEELKQLKKDMGI